MKRTIEKWSKKFNVIVVDPDGFDRTDPNLHKRKFTKKEFWDGLILSSCMPTKHKPRKKYFKKKR